METFKTAGRVAAIVLLLSQMASAQDWRSLGADELFALARKEVFAAQRATGQDKLRHILEKSPNYDEVRIFLARTYAWDEQYEQARAEIQTVLIRHPDQKEALNALIDVELWSKRYAEALAVVRRGLKDNPLDGDFLFSEAKALAGLGRDQDALHSLKNLLQIHPAHDDARSMYARVRQQTLVYTACVAYGADFFNRIFDPAHHLSVQLSRDTPLGSAHIRLNHAARFQSTGLQLEADLYPQIAKGIYAYLNYGYSNSSLFPEHRSGAEFYFNLPHRLEASGGFRYIDFGPQNRIAIYTGALGWYFGNYWLSARPYITPDAETGTSVSATVSLRRYFSDGENYVGLTSGLGFSPDWKPLQRGTGFTENELYMLKSQRIGLIGQKTFADSWIVSLSADLARQELIFDQGKYVLMSSTALSLKKKF